MKSLSLSKQPQNSSMERSNSHLREEESPTIKYQKVMLDKLISESFNNSKNEKSQTSVY